MTGILWCILMRLLPPLLVANLAQAGDVSAHAVLVAKQVEAYLRSEMKERRIPGLQVAVVHHGNIVLRGAYGVANLQHGVPVMPSTEFGDSRDVIPHKADPYRLGSRDEVATVYETIPAFLRTGRA